MTSVNEAAVLQDDIGRRLEIPLPARRIVSLIPSLTESLFVLGAGERVVGITRFCIEPPEAASRARQVGGCKNPDLDAITALSPDVVLVNAEENRREDFEALEARGLRCFVTFTRTVADVRGLLVALGRIAGCEEEAGNRERALAAAIAVHSGALTRRPTRVFCPIWKNPWMGFNADTYADDLLRQVGGANILAEESERYCRIELEQIATMDPEVILLPDEPYVFRDRDLTEMQALCSTSAWRNGRVHRIDGKALLWYGVRTASALDSLCLFLSGD